MFSTNICMSSFDVKVNVRQFYSIIIIIIIIIIIC